MNAVSAIPIYLPSDTSVARFFEENRDEVHLITGATLIVLHAVAVQKGQIRKITGAISSDRYPDLRLSHLPCLRLEKDGQSFNLKLPRDKDAINDLLRKLVDATEDAHNLSQLEEAMAPPKTVPAWFPVAGYAAGAVTLVFLMGLVVASLIGLAVPLGGKWLVTAVLALGCALAGSFIGGEAVASGKLPFPFMNGNPIAFSVAGGVGFFFLVLLLGYFTYIKV